MTGIDPDCKRLWLISRWEAPRSGSKGEAEALSRSSALCTEVKILHARSKGLGLEGL